MHVVRCVKPSRPGRCPPRRGGFGVRLSSWSSQPLTAMNPVWRCEFRPGAPFLSVVPWRIIRAWTRRTGRPTSNHQMSCSACGDALTDLMRTSRRMLRLRLAFPNWRQPNVERGLPSPTHPQHAKPLPRNALRSLRLRNGHVLGRHRFRSPSARRPPSMRVTDNPSPSRNPHECRSAIPNPSTEPSRPRGGAADACCPGPSPAWRCWPQPSPSVPSARTRTSPNRSHDLPRRANPPLLPSLPTMTFL